VKLAKFKGEFVWHHHETEDELFLVVNGELLIKFRDSEVRVGQGEFVIVPKGIEHLPIAEQEVHVLLIEPKSTLNTGNLADDRTVRNLERISHLHLGKDGPMKHIGIVAVSAEGAALC
jgi:mannose-6-phosphate isomerase-like protein (cupin superfamily)